MTEGAWMLHPYTLTEPAQLCSAAVFSSPHSGRLYSRSFQNRARLDPLALRASEDAYVDRLFAAAPEFGAPLLAASFPRAYVDVNRAEDELDSALIHNPPKRRTLRSLRVAAGLGVVPRVVAEGRPIYDGKISYAEAQARIVACYRPYHGMLGRLLDRARTMPATPVLFDCHSMPSGGGRTARGRVDVVLGDCHGTACSPELMTAALDLFRNAGFSVARNAPFAGGYITQTYGRPGRGVHAIQIELDRGLYLDERKVKPSARFAETRAALRPVIAGLVALARTDSLPAAAE